jgi:ABC-2 type transport system permease protein
MAEPVPLGGGSRASESAGSLPATVPAGSLPATVPAGSLPATVPAGSLPATVPAGSLPATAGVIHDIGYQRYTGARLGRGYAIRSLYTHGIRTAYGLGRSGKAKVFPWLVVGIVSLVAAVLTAARAQVGQVILSYAMFPRAMTLLTVLFCAVTAPELVSRDLRTGVLPLYFSRPLTRSDYALAKLAAMVSAVWLLLAGPLTLMLVGGAFSLPRFGLVWGELRGYALGLGMAGLFALVYSALALMLASFAGRRAVAAAVIVAVFLFTTPVVGVLRVLGGETTHELGLLASPLTLVNGAGQWLFRQPHEAIGPYGPVYAAVAAGLLVACTLALLLRYRRVAR